MTENWVVLDETELLRHGGRITVTTQHVRLPDGREVPDFLRFATQSFACIFARLPDGRVICERQYKHGAGRVILTLPAGSQEADEPPLQTAQRELLEETGHESADWTSLGSATTHANAGGGTCHMFLARDCRKVAEPDSGDLETMSLEFLELSELLRVLREGGMPLLSDSSTVLNALMAEGAL